MTWMKQLYFHLLDMTKLDFGVGPSSPIEILNSLVEKSKRRRRKRSMP